ncbi:MAG: hypothetical protein WA087_01295 [Candidatus Saccharimonadales bacterium]
MKIIIILWFVILAFFVGLIVSPFAKEYLNKEMSSEYNAKIQKIASIDLKSGDKFVLGYVVLGNSAYYVYRDASNKKLDYVEKDSVLLVEDNETQPKYMDCSDISVCKYEGEKSRKLVVPVGYELRRLKADINLTPIDD